MNRKRTISIILGLLVVLMAALFIVKVDAHPPGGTRVIVDKTNGTYITPPCFNKAVTTNNLMETTWAQARELPYKPESACTEQSLQPESKRLVDIAAQKLGLQKGKWSW